MKRLAVAGVYLVGFWVLYPAAETVVWVWNRWDRLRARDQGVHTKNWYTG